MGGGGSTINFGGSLNEIVEKLMPMYYQKEAVTQDDIYVAENSWRMIIEGNSPMMVEMRQLTGLDNADGMDLYRELFFTRLFDIHEEAKPLFSEKAVRSGKFLGSVMNLCFTQLLDVKGFRKKIAALGESHCQMGIRTIEYGVIGDVLFWSLHKILRDQYTRRVEEAWCKLFSSMLRIIVPIAVSFERDSGRFHRASVQRAQTASTFFTTRGRNSLHAGTSASVQNVYNRTYAKTSDPIPEDVAEIEAGNLAAMPIKGGRAVLPIVEGDESVSVMIKPKR